MKEHPILFKGVMIRAILDGSKVQTRRTNLKTKYAVGDFLWVKETFRMEVNPNDGHEHPIYRASWQGTQFDGTWKSALFMPRGASRITLEVTALREERLQDISEEDSEAEGVISNQEYADRAGEANLWPCPQCDGFQLHMAGSLTGVCEVDCRECDTAKKRYRQLWSSINGPGSWDENPVVRVISFKVVK